MPYPSGINIEGVLYPIKHGNNAFSIDHQPTVIQQADLAGSSRPSKTSRPDTLTWRWDDWSGGEGQTWITPDVVFAEISVGGQTDSFKKYYSSDLAVDISVPGQISLGKVATDELASIGTLNDGSGPFLEVLAEHPWVLYNTNAKERTDDTPTWTARTTNATTGPVCNGSVAFGNYVYASYGSTDGIKYMNSTTAGTSFSVPGAENPFIADGRLYGFAGTGSGPVSLKRTPDLTAGATFTTVGVVSGTLHESGINNIGSDIYIMLTTSGMGATVHRYDGTALSTYFQPPIGFRGGGPRVVFAQNGVLFLGGYFPGTSDIAAVLYSIPGGPAGEIGRITPTTSMRVSALFSDQNNGIIIGTNTGEVFRYDMGTGGMSRFCSGQSTGAIASTRINTMCWANGKYFFGTRTDALAGAVYSTNVGTYPNETIVTGSKWDYLFPEEEKILLSVTINASIPSGCTVKFAFKADDGSTITTDASGAAMSMTNSDGAYKTFTVSNAGTERIFRILQPYLYLDTNTGGDSKSTPIVYSVLMKATSTGKQKFINATIDLSNERADNRPSSAQLTGSKLGQTLETLIENSANRIITVKVPYEKTDLPYPRSEDTYSCVVHQSHIEYQTPGEGFAQLVLRIVP